MISIGKPTTKFEEIKEVVRQTMAPVRAMVTKSTAGTQTEQKTETVMIDDHEAIVIYNYTDTLIRNETEHDTDRSKSISMDESSIKAPNETERARTFNKEIEKDHVHLENRSTVAQNEPYKMSVKAQVSDNTHFFNEEIDTRSFRMLTKLESENGQLTLIDRNRLRSVKIVGVEIQTEKVDFADLKPATTTIEIQTDQSALGPSDEKANITDEDIEDSADNDEIDEEEQDALFGNIDSRQKDLNTIQEEDEDEGTFKEVPKKDTAKEIEDKKKKDAVAEKIRASLKSSVMVNQLGGRGQSMLREQSIINRISKIKNFDFLALRSIDNKNYKRVSKILERYDEKPIGVREGMEVFSEYIQKIDTAYNKHKRKIMITSAALYQLSKNFSVVVRVPLENIKGLTLIKKSATVMAIHCPSSFDHLIEIVRRTEIVMFLMHMFETRKLPKPKIYYADGLKTKTDKENAVPEKKILKFDPSQKSDVSKVNLTLMHNLSSINFINSPKYGYLMKRSQNWFKQWTEKFCVITNVGLLYYNDPSQKPRNLFPIIDASIIPVKESAFKTKYVFQIKSFKWEIIFRTKTEQDYVEWMEAFRKLQHDTDKRKNALIEQGILNHKIFEDYKASAPSQKD